MDALVRARSIGKADVFNFDFRHLQTFNCENFKIYRVDNFGLIQNQVRAQREYVDNIHTGFIEMDLSSYVKPSEQIFSDNLNKISKLLSFAQNRDVFFNNYSIESKGNIKGPIKKSIRTGKKRLVPIIRVNGIQEFLARSLPLLRDPDFENNTRINRMLDFWFEAVLYTASVVEINVSLFFIAFEMIANNYYRLNPKVFVLDEAQWKNVSNKVNVVCDELGISGRSKSRVCGSIGFVKMGSSFEKIMYLLESLDLDHHESDVNEIKNVRNDIIHGYDLKPDYGGDDPMTLSFKAEKLAVKIILTYFNFINNHAVHSSFGRDRELDAQI